MDEARQNYTMLDFIKSTALLEFIECLSEEHFLVGENTSQVQQKLLVGNSPDYRWRVVAQGDFDFLGGKFRMR